jgi:hypothetical protein
MIDSIVHHEFLQSVNDYLLIFVNAPDERATRQGENGQTDSVFGQSKVTLPRRNACMSFVLARPEALDILNVVVEAIRNQHHTAATRLTQYWYSEPRVRVLPKLGRPIRRIKTLTNIASMPRIAVALPTARKCSAQNVPSLD